MIKLIKQFTYRWSLSRICLPVCSKGCVHGRCVRPEVCECNFGWTSTDCSVKCQCNDHGQCANETHLDVCYGCRNHTVVSCCHVTIFNGLELSAFSYHEIFSTARIVARCSSYYPIARFRFWINIMVANFHAMTNQRLLKGDVIQWITRVYSKRRRNSECSRVKPMSFRLVPQKLYH